MLAYLLYATTLVALTNAQLWSSPSGVDQGLRRLNLFLENRVPDLARAASLFDSVLKYLEHRHNPDEDPVSAHEDLTEDPCSFITELVSSSSKAHNASVSPQCVADLQFVCQSLGVLASSLLRQCNANCDCESAKKQWIGATSWAPQFIDSAGKMPSDVSNANYLWYGSREQCLGIEVDAHDLIGSRHAFKGRSCHVDLVLKPSGTQQLFSSCLAPINGSAKLPTPPKTSASDHEDIFPVVFGFCVPSTCNSKDIDLITKTVFQSEMSFTNAECEDDHDIITDYPALVVLIILLFLLLFMLACTFYHRCVLGRPKLLPKLQKLFRDDSFQATLKSNGEGLSSTMPSKSKSPPRFEHSSRLSPGPRDYEQIWNENGSLKNYQKILLCFSAHANISEAVSPKLRPGDVGCLHGIRTLSVIWSILGYTYFYTIGLADNPEMYRDWAKSCLFQAIENASLAADTFLLVNGFLLFKNWKRKQEKLVRENPEKSPRISSWLLHYYLEHIVKLFVPYCLVIAFTATLYSYLGHGVLWAKDSSIRDSCVSNWWMNILFINNFFSMQNTCLPWSWYLSVYVQLLLVSPVLLLVFDQFATRFSSVICAFILLPNLVAIAVLTASFNLPPTATISSNPAEWPGLSQYLDIVYVKPYFRYTPLVVGIYLASILPRFNKNTLNWVFALVLWIIATALCSLVLFGTFPYVSSDYFPFTLRIVYAAAHKLFWSIGIALVIFLCSRGYGGIVNSILCADWWVALSRLAFGAALFGPLVVVFGFQTLTKGLHLHHFTQFYFFLTNSILVFVAALILEILATAPVRKLIALFLTEKQRTSERRLAMLSSSSHNDTCSL